MTTSMAVGLSAFVVFIYALSTDRSVETDYALTLTAIAIAQWFTAFTARSSRRSTFSFLTSNPSMWVALLTVVCMHAAILYIPFLANLFRVAPLSLNDWLIAIAAGLPVIITEEIRKWMVRNRWLRTPHPLRV